MTPRTPATVVAGTVTGTVAWVAEPTVVAPMVSPGEVTTPPARKFVPFTVSVKETAFVVVGLMEPMVGVGAFTWRAPLFVPEAPPPAAGWV